MNKVYAYAYASTLNASFNVKCLIIIKFSLTYVHNDAAQHGVHGDDHELLIIQLPKSSPITGLLLSNTSLPFFKQSPYYV